MATSMKKLPFRNGYTIDVRLKEFRKIVFVRGKPHIIFIRFDSAKGQQLLLKLRNNSK